METVQQIWEQLKDGDINALKKLFDRYHQDIFNYGKRITDDEQLVEDALQETFIAIWKYRDTSSVPAFVKSYVLKAFRNQLLKLLNKRAKTVYTDKNPEFSFEVSFDQKIIEGENADELSAKMNGALQKLTPRQRELIYYRFYEDFSLEEIAGLMDMQIRAIYKLTARAMSALRRILGPGNLILFLFGWITS